MMPRETIADDTGSVNVQIGWSDHSLQLATEVPGDVPLLRQIMGDDRILYAIGQTARRAGWAPEPSQEVLEAMTPSNVVEEDGYRRDVESGRIILAALVDVAASHGDYRGMWASLDRSRVNEIIRVLRRARDRAFGRDE